MTRLDQYLVHKELVPSRSKAQALIHAGCIWSGEKQLIKSSQLVDLTTQIEVRANQDQQWVSRGGIKLDHAIKSFSLSVQNKVALDLGASTGGFTDVLLHYGAKKVYAVDVGHSQLHDTLRNHPQVVVRENTNARYLQAADVDESIQIITCDVSFISLKTLLPAALQLIARPGVLIALVKPQFEVGKSKVSKKGLVTSPRLQQKACQDIQSWLEQQNGWQVEGVIESPITGSTGNKEFLLVATFHSQ